MCIRDRRFCYLLLGLWQLLAARPVKGYILMDGDRKVEFNYIYQVSAHIHPYEAGGYKFAPGADCSDGHLTVCVISQSDKRKVASLLLGTFLHGGRRCRGVRTFESVSYTHLDVYKRQEYRDLIKKKRRIEVGFGGEYSVGGVHTDEMCIRDRGRRKTASICGRTF